MAIIEVASRVNMYKRLAAETLDRATVPRGTARRPPGHSDTPTYRRSAENKSFRRSLESLGGVLFSNVVRIPQRLADRRYASRLMRQLTVRLGRTPWRIDSIPGKLPQAPTPVPSRALYNHTYWDAPGSTATLPSLASGQEEIAVLAIDSWVRPEHRHDGDLTRQQTVESLIGLASCRWQNPRVTISKVSGAHTSAASTRSLPGAAR